MKNEFLSINFENANSKENRDYNKDDSTTLNNPRIHI